MQGKEKSLRTRKQPGCGLNTELARDEFLNLAKVKISGGPPVIPGLADLALKFIMILVKNMAVVIKTAILYASVTGFWKFGTWCLLNTILPVKVTKSCQIKILIQEWDLSA